MSWLAVALGLSGVWKWFRWKINANCSCEGAAPLWFRSDSRSYSFRNASELHMCFEVNMKWHSQPIFFRIVPYVQIKWVVRYRMRFNLSVENEQHTKTDQDLNVFAVFPSRNEACTRFWGDVHPLNHLYSNPFSVLFFVITAVTFLRFKLRRH